MAEHLANSNAGLETLVAQIMKEKDPQKYDALCVELWRVLEERERFKCVSDDPRGNV